MKQGTPEWLAIRKTKITATDAPIIMGENKWKSPIDLYLEKIDPDFYESENDAMKKGLRLEPFARALFELETGIDVTPKVIIKDWAMASLDGISACGKYIVELKCPSVKYHEMALKGIVPSHYKAQLQHQMWVCDVEKIFYYSFDGLEGKLIQVTRDPCYLETLIHFEHLFYQLLTTRDTKKMRETWSAPLISSYA